MCRRRGISGFPSLSGYDIKKGRRLCFGGKATGAFGPKVLYLAYHFPRNIGPFDSIADKRVRLQYLISSILRKSGNYGVRE